MEKSAWDFFLLALLFMNMIISALIIFEHIEKYFVILKYIQWFYELKVSAMSNVTRKLYFHFQHFQHMYQFFQLKKYHQLNSSCSSQQTKPISYDHDKLSSVAFFTLLI